MMRHGYARVSSKTQDYSAQVDALKAAGCERIFSEKASGKSAKDRPEFSKLMRALVPGDTVPLDLFAYPMMRVLVAARAFGLRAIDGPCGAFRDLKLTAASAIKAAAMGFDGKQVIHPDQIETTKQAFLPSDEDLIEARRVIAAMDHASTTGQGAVMLDGKMIDAANVRMAQRIIQLAS